MNILFKHFKTSFLFFLLISCSENEISKNTTIKIYFEHDINNTPVTFCRFFDDSPEHYFFMYDTAKEVAQNTFLKQFQLNKTGIVTIVGSPIIPKTYIICDPGDEIHLFISKDSLNRNQMSFKGQNKRGQTLFHASSLRRVNHLAEFISKFKDLPSKLVVEKTEGIKDSLLVPFKQMMERKEISSPFYDMVEKTSEATVISAIFNVFGQTFGKSPDQNAQETMRHFFTKYDPFSDRYKEIDMVSRSVNAEYKCMLIANGILQSKITTPGSFSGLWNSKLKHNETSPLEIQKIIKVTKIMFSRSFGENTFEEDYNDFVQFKKYFPNSPYVEVFKEKYFSEEEIVLRLNENTPKILPTSALYKDTDKNVEIIRTHNSNNIGELVQDQFHNKPVLVDMWATWCSPCIKEFAHKKELNAFLKKNDISLLYVSIDKPTAYENWKSALIKHQLEGNHFFATDDLTDFFPEDSGIPHNISIPRYLLFNKNGVMLDGDMPRPSSGKLENRILELMEQN